MAKILTMLRQYTRLTIEWVLASVIILYALTHSCSRVGCWRYPGAGLIPGISLIETAMTAIAIGAIVVWAASTAKTYISDRLEAIRSD